MFQTQTNVRANLVWMAGHVLMGWTNIIVYVLLGTLVSTVTQVGETSWWLCSKQQFSSKLITKISCK